MKIRTKPRVLAEPPTLLTQLQFIDGFANAVYNNIFTLACRPDLKFGSDSQGHTSHLCVERCYVTKAHILELMDENGLQQSLPFAPYIKALERIPRVGNIDRGGRKMPYQ